MDDCFDGLRQAAGTLNRDAVREAAWRVHEVCMETFSMLDREEF